MDNENKEFENQDVEQDKTSELENQDLDENVDSENEEESIDKEESQTENQDLVEAEAPKEATNEKPKNTYLVLIIFIVIALLLTGYIVYDKVIKKEEVKEPQSGDSNNVETDELLNNEDSITKNINGKDVKIEFKYSVKTGRTDVDILVNGKKVFTIPVVKQETVDSLCLPSDTAKGDCSERAMSLVKMIKDKNLGTIKGDKDYFYFDLTFMDKILIVNDEGDLLYTKNDIDKSSQYELEIIDSSCLNYDNFNNLKDENLNPWPTMYIGKDGIYYLNEYTESQIREYKIAVNNNKVTDSLVATCSGKVGSKGNDNEDSITKNINGKDVKIEFKYSAKTGRTDVDILVNSKKVFTIPVVKQETADSLCLPSDTAKGDCSERAMSLVKTIKDKNLGTIKGDKEYFYFDLTFMSKILIVNDEGTLLYTKNDIGKSSQYELEILDSSCLNYDNFNKLKDKNLNPWPTMYIGKDGIYYLTEYTGLQLREYKIAVNKNKVTDSIAATCFAKVGSKGNDNLYIINKTKKVNGKDVNLEYRFRYEETNDSASIIGDLYIDNKKTIEKAYLNRDEGDATAVDEIRKMANPDFENKSGVNNSMNYWKNLSSEIDKQIGVIKGDKEYLYLITTILERWPHIHLIVFGDNGKQIFDKEIYNGLRWVILDSTCANYQKFVDQAKKDTWSAKNALYYIGENELYYVEDSGDCGNEDSVIPQYKITFKDNKANFEKIAECKYEAEGACG